MIERVTLRDHIDMETEGSRSPAEAPRRTLDIIGRVSQYARNVFAVTYTGDWTDDEMIEQCDGGGPHAAPFGGRVERKAPGIAEVHVYVD